jgi:restriction system protein
VSIPKHHEIRIPALKLLVDGSQLKVNEFEMPLAAYFELSADEIDKKYASGKAKIFYDRITWALSYMNMAGLVRKPKRGVYEISALGLDKFKDPEALNQFIALEIEKRKKTRSEERREELGEEESQTPQEELYRSADEIRESRNAEILDTILSKTPREFEKLVVNLLQRMGYGGEVQNSGIVTPYGNDGGIDGIIKEDILGLGRIHLQAKRYQHSNSVQRDEIQKFVGALAVAQSNKGVFITTSSFTKGAIEYAESLNGATTLILIDGRKLADYLYEYDVGVQIEQTIHIKKLDSEFWDSMTDDLGANN